MSLDVYLEKRGWEQVYWANITHNLTTMADKAGIYKALWRPEEIGIKTAGQLIEPLSEGYALLLSDWNRFRKYNPENGWGSYDSLCAFLADYLEACKANPKARVRASR